MNQTYSARITSNIAEAQRCVDNLYATASNFIGSSRVIVNQKVLTAAEVLENLLQERDYIQKQLREAAAELAKQ